MLLGTATLIFANLTWWAWNSDQARQQAAHTSLEQQISEDALALEQQYLSRARTLIALLNPQDALLTEIDSARISLTTQSSLAQRQAEFDTMADRIRLHLLQSPAPADNDALLQEWRRLTDQMNGALHRRSLLLEELQAH